MQPTADPPMPALSGSDFDISPGMALPLPDEAAAIAARDRLAAIDIGISAPTVTALGMLAEAVVFVAAVQGTAYPRPLLSTRVVLVTGAHAGGVVAGPAPDPRNGTPLQHLAGNSGASIVTLEWQPASAAIELADAITTEQMDAALRAGWDEAERAADEGIELLVLAAGGAGSATAAAAVVAAVTGAEPTALLARVVTPAGIYDDNAWMTRCLALRDALHRVRDRDGDPRTVLSALGGADIAAATGLVLGAANRRTPIMIDGPVGAAAALLANDFAPNARRWVILPDTGRHMAVRLAAEALELRPWLDLCLDLGEGAASLAALPMLQTALTLASAGEPVEPSPPSRYDSTGNQVFVGVAKPVEPVAGAEEPAGTPSAATREKADAGTAVKAAGAKAKPIPPVKGEPTKEPPAKEIPAKETPAKETPAKETAAKEPSAKQPQAKEAPARETPAKAAPASAARPTPVKATPAKTAPPLEPAAKAGQTTLPPTKDKDALVREAAAKEASPKDASPKAASAEVAADKDASAKIASAKETPAKETPAKETPAKEAPVKDAADKDAADKDASAKVASAKETPAKEAPVKDSAATTAPAKDGAGKAAAGNEAASKDVASKDVAGKEVAAKDVAAKDASPTRPAPAPREAGTPKETAAAKDGPAATDPPAAKDSPPKDSPAAKDGPAATKSSPTAVAEIDGARSTEDADSGGDRASNGRPAKPNEATTVTAPSQITSPRPRKRS